MHEIKEHILRISEIVQETHSVKVFRFELPEGMGIDFYPGQFFMVSFIDDLEIKTSRAYSVASSPLNKKYLEIALNKVGTFTTKLFQMKKGDMLKFKGPYGKFYFNEEIRNELVLIAGGTGITPLISIIRYCSDKRLSNKIRFIYSVRTPQEIIYKKELEQIRKSNSNFEYIITITRPEDYSEWQGNKGRIGLSLLKESIGDAEKNIYFLCGPKEFVHSIIEILQSFGVEKEKIKSDVWG